MKTDHLKTTQSTVNIITNKTNTKENKVENRVREKIIVVLLKEINKHTNNESACEIGWAALVGLTLSEGNKYISIVNGIQAHV